MSLNKKQRAVLLKQHCGVINDDDAIDPKHYFYNKRKHPKKYRKVFQLCRQISETLQFVLREGNERFEKMSIVDVVPAPDSRRLLVIVCVENLGSMTASEVDSLMKLVESDIPRLRMEIARAINRRKTPNLIFEFTHAW